MENQDKFDLAGANATRPYWFPPDIDVNALPDEIKAAIAGLVNPVYVQLVLQAQDGLERSIGSTIVFLLWREILAQMQFGQDFAHGTSSASSEAERDAELGRYLRLVAAKLKASAILFQLQAFRRRYRFLDSLCRVPNQTRLQPGEGVPTVNEGGEDCGKS
jgi:hypothetical protein